MSVERRDVWQIGLVVEDLEAAVAELGEVLGLAFREPKEHAPVGHPIRVTMSTTGPPYFELIEGAGGTPWDGHTGPRIDHLAFFADDVTAERERLVAEGCPVIIDLEAAGMRSNYHLLPETNLRVETVERSSLPWIAERWGVEDPEARWGAGAPWQLGFMVRDIEAARDELTRVLGLAWTPVKTRGRDGQLSVCMSTSGPPYFELVQTGVTSDFHWRSWPHFDHLAYWAEDLEAETARLAGVGATHVSSARPGEIHFHHAPRSGLRLEVMSGAYRETIRSGWGFAEVG